MNQKIPIIIPVHNNPSYVKACIESVSESGEDVRVIIIDCNSDLETRDVLYSWKTHLDHTIIPYKYNLGFAGAINKGLEYCDLNTPICILHSDTIVSRLWLSKLLPALDKPSIAVAVPRTNYADSRVQEIQTLRDRFSKIKPINKAPITYAGVKNVMRTLYLPKTLNEYADTLTGLDEVIHIDGFDSFCMLFNSGVFNTVGKFDTSFFPTRYENKAWAFKAAQKGMTCCLVNTAYVHHFGNITSDGPGYSFPDISRGNFYRYEEYIAAGHSGQTIENDNADVINLKTNTNPKIFHCEHMQGTHASSLSLFFRLSSLPPVTHSTTDLTVVTYNTEDYKSSLERSLCNFNGPFIVVGKGEKNWNNIRKIHLLNDALKNINTPYIMSSDSKDVIILDDLSEILKKFKSMNQKILFNAEVMHWPDYPHTRAFEESKARSMFRYLNSGVFIGETDFVRQIVKEATLMESKTQDQEIYKELYLKYYPDIQIDDQCCIFQTLYIGDTKSNIHIRDFIKINKSI